MPEVTFDCLYDSVTSDRSIRISNVYVDGNLDHTLFQRFSSDGILVLVVSVFVDGHIEHFSFSQEV